MASTLNLQNTINWALPILRNYPFTAAPGFEPALSNANLVKQTILAPPFAWRWNRKTVNFSMSTSTQDVAVAVSDFGFIEGAIRKPVTGKGIVTLEVKKHLELTDETQPPHAISMEFDDNAGNITFRVFALADQAYPATVTYQAKAALMASLAASWAPIPDEMAYIYNQGFLALMMLFAGDGRYEAANKKFIGGLLGLAQGLTDMEKNLFLENWMSIINQLNVSGQKAQQGITGRTF
jgi:hypothetical protein